MSSWWRRVPAPLWLACGVATASQLVIFFGTLAQDDAARVYSFSGEGWRTALSGISPMIAALLLVGVWWLGGRLTGAAAVGARIAMAALAVRFALYLGGIAWQVHYVLHPDDAAGTAGTALDLIRSASAIGVAVGLGLAARRWWTIALGAVLAVLASPPAFVQHWYFTHVHTLGGEVLLMDGLALAWDMILLALVLLACGAAGEEASVAGSSPGLRQISFALHGRAVVGAIVACVGLLFVAPADTRSIVELYSLFRITVTAVEVALLVVLALGALAAVRSRSELPAWAMVISAAAVLWVGGVLLQRIAALYVAMHPTSWPERQPVDVFVRVSPATIGLVAAAGVTGVLISLAVAARRRGLDELHRRLVARTGWFVGLALSAIATTAWLGAPIAETTLAALVMFGVSLVTVAALWVAGRACSEAAGALAREPGLPAARVIRS